jgi:chromosome segregation ATPase
VEYLSQLNLKGDMVMDELKRVSADRDEYKKKFEESEKQREKLGSSQSIATGEGSVAARETTDSTGVETPSASVKSPVQSVLGIFSPKQKAQATFENKDVSEEFFSYDDEIPKLQAEVKEKTAELEGLQAKVTSLESDLAVVQETSSGMVENLERATRELSESKDTSAKYSATLEARQKQIDAQTEELRNLKEKLQTTETKLADLEEALQTQRTETSETISALQGDHAKENKTAAEALESHEKARKDHETLVGKLNNQIKELQQSKALDAKRVEFLKNRLEQNLAEEKSALDAEEAAPTPSTSGTATPAAATGAAKKKNKKKKKGANATASKDDSAVTTTAQNSVPPTPGTDDLQAEISRLKYEITDKDAQIAKLQTKRKTEEELREELENMQDNFLSIGQEHVEAKEKIKELRTEKIALQEQISKLESEIEGYKTQSEASEKSGADLVALMKEYEVLKDKFEGLKTDHAATQQLATSRYRDLTDLKGVIEIAQPELKTLRAENANLKSIKDELSTKTSDLRRLEARERDLKADMAIFKKQAADRDNEVRTLNEKITQETNSRLRAEDQNRIAQRDMRKSEAEKIQLATSGEKSATELAKVQEEAGKLRTVVRDLEDQVSKLTTESKCLREEVELRGAQYTTTQNLLSGIQNQTQEYLTQLKEAASQRESLEEELAEVQRLLSERSREGETMRRLLADVDDRADAKVREMRERMEAAIEERDRAEDEASTTGRRRAREVDELKTKIRDYERDLKRAIDDRDELLISEKELKRKRGEFEKNSEAARQEANDSRSAMVELQDALNGSEKQARDAEKQRNDLRRMLDEVNQRYEKQSKELKTLQAKLLKATDESSRSSFETGRSHSLSPANGNAAPGKMDYVYLKTILLQFLEQKDKKRQADLIKTVLGTLLHMDKYVPFLGVEISC